VLACSVHAGSTVVATKGPAVNERDPKGSVIEREIVVPVVREELEVSKRVVPREHVRLTKTVDQREQIVDVPLFDEQIEVQRIPMERVVASPSAPRQEGDTWIYPVYEEVLTVEKRLVLREEVHVKRTRRAVHKPQSVTLRREEVEVIRTDPKDTTAASSK